jgi:hypothetical protein
VTCAVTVMDVDENNMLGDYLRARRELIQPDSVGLPAGGVRRVAGLRREEVAMLAGISSDYYLRLEQGRDRLPGAWALCARSPAAVRADRRVRRVAGGG